MLFVCMKYVEKADNKVGVKQAQTSWSPTDPAWSLLLLYSNSTHHCYCFPACSQFDSESLDHQLLATSEGWLGICVKAEENLLDWQVK